VVVQPRTLHRSLLKKLDILLLLCQYIHISSLINFSINNEALICGVSALLIDQMTTFHVFREVYYMLASEFSTAYHTALQGLRMERHNLKTIKKILK
jgi:hypothetical protein